MIPTVMLPMSVETIAEVAREVQVLHLKYGDHHPDGTGYSYLREQAEKAARECDTNFEVGMGSWRLILRAQYRKALATKDPVDLHIELIKTAAAALAWASAIEDRPIFDNEPRRMCDG